MTRNVTLTIDDIEVTVPEGTTIIDAADEAGVPVPLFCQEMGKPEGGRCRKCVAEVRVWDATTGSHRSVLEVDHGCWDPVEEGMHVLVPRPPDRARWHAGTPEARTLAVGPRKPLVLDPAPDTATVTLAIDGIPVTVPKGTPVIEAARQVGIQIPHFCYHPGLPVDGNCRMCIADVRTWNARREQYVPARRPAVTCKELAQNNMQVFTDTEPVLEARASVMEFLLINHPIDCPICDKAGECMLQDQYMQHSGSRSELREQKVHKPRLVPFGERILYNGERCILCRRCTRFVEHVTQTHELGIVNRGDRSVVEVVEGGTFDNPYSDCVADVCPVGALTKTDFRFKSRVWFLKHTESVCGACSRNCNVVVDHDGDQVIRVMPRQRDEINGHWMCNEGRDLPREFSHDRRPSVPELQGEYADDETVVAWLGSRLAEAKKAGPERWAVLVSPWASNEEAWLLAWLVKKLRGKNLDVMTGWTTGYAADDLLHTADHNPNRRGVVEAGIKPAAGGMDTPSILSACEAGEIDLLLVWGAGLASDLDGDEERLTRALDGVATVASLTGLVDEVTERAQAVLPLRTWLESDGTWTNLDGHSSRFRRALRPAPEARDGFELLVDLCGAAGLKPPVKTLRDVRKKLKLDTARDALQVLDGRFEFPGDQTLFRHSGGASEV
jgi:NADH-quinone oxidoreductase subunit G